MKIRIRVNGHLCFFLIIALLIGTSQRMVGENNTGNQNSYQEKMLLARELTMQKSDSALIIYQECYNQSRQLNDSAKMCDCLIRMGELYRMKGKYSLAFDNFWSAVYLSKSSGDYSNQSRAQRKLAVLYTVFNMDSVAYKHLYKSLSLSKKIIRLNNEDVYNLNANFISLAKKERQSGNYRQALHYLDSLRNSQSNSYIQTASLAERGVVLAKQGHTGEAIKLLKKSKNISKETGSNYFSIALKYLGDVMAELNHPDSAKYYYLQCIDHCERTNHEDYLTVEVLQNLSQLFYKEHRYQKAYSYLDGAKALADSLNQLRDKANGDLFQIKNNYLKTVKEKENFIEKQNRDLKVIRDTQTRLKIIVGLLALLVSLLLWTFVIRQRLKSALRDKREVESNARIKAEKHKTEIQQKSRELASYALQLADKHNTIDELLKIIEQREVVISNKHVENYKKSSADFWNEFNRRFVEIDADFYQKLQSTHPSLTVTELRYCALIKLNLTSKEVARLLNVTLHSVHISRSRIRKKIGIERGESLDRYIGEI